MNTRFYSQRMLNPFHGIVNAVEITGADAVTRDGRHWTLYVQHHEEFSADPQQLEDDAQYPDIKFGKWSADGGLRRSPVRYVTDYSVIDELGEALLSEIRRLQPGLPFPAGDCYELWLMHSQTGLPLALLDARCDVPRGDASGDWSVGVMARREFAVAASCDALEKLVNEAASSERCWIRREPGGGGVILAQGRQLGPAEFPALMLEQNWPAAEEEELVAGYLNWQAPWLLELQGLNAGVRANLERHAANRALLVEERYRNYPQVEDQKVINTALVEARLRNAVPSERESEQDEIEFFLSGN